jgi:hypothetical protein
MATSVFLSNLNALTVNSVSLADQCTGITFTNLKESLDVTSLTDTSRVNKGGLFNNEVTMTLFQSYITGETYATLAALVGTQTTVAATVIDGAVTKVFTLANCYLESMPVISASLGEMSTIDITFTGGTYSVA